jgi:hypothetical protein
MELATDIMAIIGWALFGIHFPAWIYSLATKNIEFKYRYLGLSFGLIAASFVLG